MTKRYSNKLLYVFITLSILTGTILVAYAVAPNPGHDIIEVGPPNPCSANQYLQWDGSNWKCASLSTCTADDGGQCYITPSSKSALDSDLIAGNIKSGVNIFGVDGTYTGSASSCEEIEVVKFNSPGICLISASTGYVRRINGNLEIMVEGYYNLVSGQVSCTSSWTTAASTSCTFNGGSCGTMTSTITRSGNDITVGIKAGSSGQENTNFVTLSY